MTIESFLIHECFTEYNRELPDKSFIYQKKLRTEFQGSETFSSRNMNFLLNHLIVSQLLQDNDDFFRSLQCFAIRTLFNGEALLKLMKPKSGVQNSIALTKLFL